MYVEYGRDFFFTEDLTIDFVCLGNVMFCDIQKLR